MKVDWPRFAPFAIYLSIAAAIGAVVLYVLQRQFNLPLQILLGLVVIGLTLFAIMDPNRVRKAFTGRQARYGSNTLVMSLAFVGIIVVVNYLVFTHPKQWDLTEDKMHTLSPETKDILEKLPDKVSIKAFYSDQVNSTAARNLLDNYQLDSNGKLDYQFIDPDAEPVLARQFNVSRDGTLVVQIADRYELVTLISEEELSSALVRLANPGERVVYFLTGHGEKDISGTEDTAYSQVKAALEAKNYTAKSLNLLVDRAIPADALAVIIAGSLKPLAVDEVQLIKDYQAAGGGVVVLSEPVAVTEFGDSVDPVADYLAQQWGITLINDLVIDLSANPATVAVANEYGSSAITEKLQGMVSIFPTARSIGYMETGQISYVALVKTSQNSWAETNIAALAQNQVDFNEAQDLPGPVTLAVSAEDQATLARIVVVGDSDFASNGAYASYGNGSLFLNIVDWAAQQDNLINMTAKETTQRIVVPPTQLGTGLIFLVAILVVPGLTIFAGIMAWIQRRRRG
jgi:ABC-type uncharacterized transport system involved in gliding motility auxiliary subunit